MRVAEGPAVRHLRETRLKLLKPSTRITYNDRLDRILVPRSGDVGLADITGEMLQKLEVDLAESRLAPSTCRNEQIVVRSVMHSALDAGMLARMPRFPRLPRVSRKTPNPIHRDDIEAFLAKSSATFKVAVGLAAFAGLRRSEVIGLRWSDVDLKGSVITVRRAITEGRLGAGCAAIGWSCRPSNYPAVHRYGGKRPNSRNCRPFTPWPDRSGGCMIPLMAPPSRSSSAAPVPEPLQPLVKQLAALNRDDFDLVVRAARSELRPRELRTISWESLQKAKGIVNLGGNADEDCKALYDG